MNTYSATAILKLFDKLEITHDTTGISFVVVDYFIHGIKIELEIKAVDFYIYVAKNKRIPDNKNKHVEELMNLIFEVKMDLVPTYIGSFPSIVAWRMELGQ